MNLWTRTSDRAQLGDSSVLPAIGRCHCMGISQQMGWCRNIPDSFTLMSGSDSWRPVSAGAVNQSPYPWSLQGGLSG